MDKIKLKLISFDHFSISYFFQAKKKSSAPAAPSSTFYHKKNDSIASTISSSSSSQVHWLIVVEILGSISVVLSIGHFFIESC